MSGSSGGSGGGAIGRREVAVRCFAAEYDDASLEYSESDEERAPNYVVTPTGARVNRLFVVGVLTEVESVSDDVLRGRVVDPTGAFVVYAGQYQPDAKTFLERAEPPQFVAVTGKARTFEPDDGDRVYTSIRPESINAVDSDTRDRWTVQAAEFTVERVATFAAALEREERGQALREALLASGVDPALAAGIPRAIDHYGTAGAYLAAVREMALQAAEVVAGERDEVDPVELAPGEGGPADVDLADGVDLEAVAEPTAAGATGASTAASPEAPAGTTDASEATSTGAAETTTETASAEANAGAETEAAGTASEPAEEPATESDAEPASDAGADDDLGDFDDFGADEEGAEGETGTAGTETAEAGGGVEAAETPDAEAPGTEASGAASDEMYEMDEEEREAVEEEFGTEFSTGSEVGEPGEADIETPGPVDGGEPSGAGETETRTETEADETAADEAESVSDAAPAAPEDEAAAPGDEAGVATAEAEGQTDADEASGETAAEEAGEEDETEPAGDEAAEEVDLQDAAVDAMADLDDGDGADREAVIEAVADEHGVDREAVEEAIQDALMGGRCYEPEDGRLKAI